MVLDVSLPRVAVHVGGAVFRGYKVRRGMSRAGLCCCELEGENFPAEAQLVQTTYGGPDVKSKS